MRNQFERLVTHFTNLVHLSDTAHVAQGGVFAVDEIPISLIYNEAADIGRFFVYADFGKPPADKEREAYYELLKHNFMEFAGKGSMFTISPVTAHVVYIESFALDTTSAEEVANSLASISTHARDWRETYFLSGPGQLVFGSAAGNSIMAFN
ncbi:CesT family type III secretion system chaperone [Hydrogenophaga sp.]|uniref:CesT family type III secretion system chaperone n=1 Tax=Hydrogenophaga sp. TaxID=1904254 RepID=UPI00271B773C|nr:CesT family type III secretion system chaperone [Hydrogenophaga sp.]MDO9435198.1 CesT family type III secretion system chaperone [Hydrogenophaga sp.]